MPSSYQKQFLKKRHSYVPLSNLKIKQIIKKATNQDITSKRRIFEGYDNEVYDITLTNTDHVILRVNHFPSAGFANEAWAMEQCPHIGIPVSEILLLDKIKYLGQEHDMMVQTKISGQSYNNISQKITPAEQKQILIKTGELMSKIHTIRVKGFYRRNPVCNSWDFPSWKKFLSVTIRDRRQEKPYITQQGFTSDEFDQMIGYIKIYQDKYPCQQPVLTHSDIGLGHVYFDEQLNIVGLIDFGESQ
ncbi:phosphotransferase, partial [Patescibacteria group bacterium]|nr:phosphotransferase [Patescibacteria group bacterium]